MKSRRKPAPVSSAELMANLSKIADEAFNKSIGELLKSVPNNKQSEADGLRAIHQVLAYHVGTIGRLIHHQFDAHGDGSTAEALIVAERDEFIEKGIEHADHHRSHYQN